MNSEKQKFLETWDKEFQTTLRVLKAFPENRQNYKPHEMSKSAKDLAWLFANEERVIFEGIVDGNIQWDKMSPSPETMKEVIALYEVIHRDAMAKVRDNDLSGTVDFFVAPKTPGKIDKFELLKTMLFDHVHHRGQFSIYLRLVGAKVPSIYGPSADEPWN